MLMHFLFFNSTENSTLWKQIFKYSRRKKVDSELCQLFGSENKIIAFNNENNDLNLLTANCFLFMVHL